MTPSQLSEKSPGSYHGNVNPELLARIPIHARHVLEIGCGTGALGAAFKRRQPMAGYYGVELFAEAASQARQALDGVLCADIERDTRAPLELGESFDALVFGDVLEHLRDPWSVLYDLRQLMAPGAVCVACVPNVAHWSLIEQLLRGRWDYAESGLLDRTHLRFFTLETAVQMLDKAGWTVIDATPRNTWPEETDRALKTLLPLAGPLNLEPAKLRRDLSALQWVIRAVSWAPSPVPTLKPLHIAALGHRKFAGVRDARVDHPLTALSSLPGVRCVWGSESITMPADFGPGVLMLQRRFMDDPVFNEQMERLIEKGWLLVADSDDDPRHWSGYSGNDYYAFRAVHAVTVTSEHLAAVIRAWNPHVKVFANAVLALPDASAAGSAGGRHRDSSGEPVRIFFGALNRKLDWEPLMPGICEAAAMLGEHVEFVVLHDREFHDALPHKSSKTFHPTLGHESYMELLATCDLALLPLSDTPFNRCKSDLKVIECGAAQVAAVCSRIVYADDARHARFLRFAQTADEWRDAILALCRSPETMRRMAQDGLKYVRSERMHAQQVSDRLDWYRQMLSQREQLEEERRFRLSRVG